MGVASPCGSRASQGNSPSGCQRLLQLPVRHRRIKEGEVVAQAGREELHVLGDKADAAAQRRQLKPAQVDVAQAD